MLFNKNDYYEIIGNQYNLIRGRFNSSSFKINGDTTLSKQMVAAHEMGHYYLNNSTVYGNVLVFYSTILMYSNTKDSRYQDIVEYLIDKCRVAQETYATWMAVSLLSEHWRKEAKSLLLDEHSEYLSYYRIGENLVSFTEDKRLAELVFTILLTSCFQSFSIAEAVLDNPETFLKVRAEDFPDTRLELIINYLPPERIARVVADYQEGILNDESSPLSPVVKTTTDKYFFLDDSALVLKFVDYFGDLLSSFFESYGSKSVVLNDGHIYYANAYSNLLALRFPNAIQNFETTTGRNENTNTNVDIKEFPVVIYIPQETVEQQHTEEITKAASEFMEALGFVMTSQDKPIFGSFWKKLVFVFKKNISFEEFDQVFNKGKKALELKYVELPTAEQTEKLSSAAEKLVNSLDKFDEGVVRCGALLVLKKKINEVSQIFIVQLNQDMIAVFDKQPQLLYNLNTAYELIAGNITSQI